MNVTKCNGAIYAWDRTGNIGVILLFIIMVLHDEELRTSQSHFTPVAIGTVNGLRATSPQSGSRRNFTVCRLILGR